MPTLRDDPLKFPQVIVSDLRMDSNKTGNWRSMKPIIDAKKCTGCLICWKYCPEACVSLTDKVPEIDMNFCKGCGVCIEECPPEAIVFEEEAGL
jgi:2-oxoacid:acceptor oxidoreductase delta subunit (pyruvate/2-ketoisovalerate family)